MFRYTEEELRDFLSRQALIFQQEAEECEALDLPIDVAYAHGAEQAYLFVLRFMDEYRLEEVTA